MSFFRDYLTQHEAQPDFRFDERDESWFVYELLLIRLGLIPRDWPPSGVYPRRFPRLRLPYIPILPRFVPDPIRELRIGPETEQALRFVTVFLCFFVPKPPTYQTRISAFKNAFIPDFAANREKQRLLFTSALPTFSNVPLDVARREWRWDVSDFFGF